MAGRYHVFLSHSSADKPAVEDLALRLRKEGIEPWLDKWHLIPGDPWMAALEEALDACDSCAVFIGPGGLGSWENEEMRAAIDRRVRESKTSKNGFRVIPVLLPGAERGQRSRLPAFLTATTWVEFRHSLDEGEPFRRLLCGIRGMEPGPSPDQVADQGQCPYRGLQVFDVEHAPFFCGREALTEWLLSELRPAEYPRGRARFLAIVGSSGSGKSSLARAGLVAALKQGALEGSAQWPIAICRPGPDPLESLAVALSKSIGIGQDPSDLIASLRKNENTLHLTTRLALESTPERRLVLLVDQFEELFTLCPREELRQALIANLLQAARVSRGQVQVLLTMRADFYGRCAAYPELAAAVSEHHFLVGPMTETELRRAIERPALLVGCEFEPGLIDMLVQDVNNQPGALPLLQYTLMELWEMRQGRRLTLSAYREIGKLEGALEKRANVLLYNFAEPERELCRRIFLRLTQPGEGTEDTKRRVPFRELLSSAGDGDQVQVVVHSLADARLITTEGAHLQPDVFVEVAHEALIRSWSKLREWVEADRAGQRTLRRLTEAANQWQEQGRDDSFLYRGARLAAAREWAALHPTELSPLENEFLQASRRRSRRRQFTLLATVVLVITALGGLTVYSLIQKNVAEANEKIANREKKLAEEKKKFAEEQKEEAERQTRFATAHRLAVQADGVGGLYPRRSVLLAAEAVQLSLRAKESPLTVAQQSLYQALGRLGGKTLLGAHERGHSAHAFSPDGRWLATTGRKDKTAQLWDLKAKDPAAAPVVLRGQEGFIKSLAISADGRWLATGSDDPRARLWNLEAKNPGAAPVVLEGHEGGIYALAISADGRWLATGGYDNTARLWDLRAKDPNAAPVVLRGHEKGIAALAISADGRWLATGSYDRTARLWDLKAKDPAAAPVVLHGHEAYIYGLAISPDGRWLAILSEDRTARLWYLQADDLLKLASVTVGRNMTLVEWDQYFHGQPYRKTFPDLPGPEGHKEPAAEQD